MMYKAILSCLLALSVSVCAAFADPGTPKQRVEDGSARIFNLLLQEEFQNPQTRPNVLKEIEKELISFFDFEEFATRTVGPKWRQFTPEQKKRFTEAFTELLRNSYIDTLNSYNGETLAYVGEVRSKDGKKVEVHTLFKGQEKDYPVSFRMIVKNDIWVVYDVIIEGISMIKNYREQFHDILIKASPEELITRIKQKANDKKNEIGTKEKNKDTDKK